MRSSERRRVKRIMASNPQLIFYFNRLIQETERLRDVAEHSEEYLANIEKEFSDQTGLNKTDYCFLFLATALQVIRWVMSKRIGENFDSESRMDHDDPSIKKETTSAENDFTEKNKGSEKDGEYKDWPAIIQDSVPFDAMDGSKDLGLKLGGTNHRVKTLGHDPLLGWIFGTANIMTDTCSLSTLNSYNIARNPKPTFDTMTDFGTIIKDTYSSAMENKVRLAAAIAKEGIHLQSDRLTKTGLPAIPGLSIIKPDWASKLSSMNYDNECFKKDFGTIGKQAMFAILINTIVSMIHELFYDPEKYPNHDLYEVKTRKIVLYSNLIASSSNLLYVGIASYLGDAKAWQKLDIGGIAVTLFRLITDVKFIARVKEEFITNEFNKLIQGDGFSFPAPWELSSIKE